MFSERLNTFENGVFFVLGQGNRACPHPRPPEIKTILASKQVQEKHSCMGKIYSRQSKKIYIQHFSCSPSTRSTAHARQESLSRHGDGVIKDSWCSFSGPLPDRFLELVVRSALFFKPIVQLNRGNLVQFRASVCPEMEFHQTEPNRSKK